MFNRRIFVAAVFIAALGCATAPFARSDRETIDQLLDDWHKAAAAANENAYFGALSENSIFFGTDSTERWTKKEFFDYAHPYFARGRAWTFHPRNRNVYFSNDGAVAWFDEILDSSSYGEMRGTGVATRSGGGWKIEQYNLTIPIPNDLAKDFVSKIREFQSKKPGA